MKGTVDTTKQEGIISIKTFWGMISGYSLVGLFSLVAGVFVGYYQQPIDGYTIEFFVIFIMMIMLIALFAHAYISLYFNEYLNKEKKQKYAGFILVLTMVIAALLVLSLALDVIENRLTSIISAIVIYLIYLFSAYFFRVKLKKLSVKGKVNINSTKYSLLYPALITVALPLYIGQSVAGIVSGNWQYIFPLIPFLVFFLILQLTSGSNIRTNTRIYLVFGSVLFILLIIAILYSQKIIYNLVFSIIWSIYLAIYESWYLLTSQDRAATGSINEASIQYVVSSIIVVTPSIVLSIYPYLNLGITFWSGFIIIHIITQITWFSKVFRLIAGMNGSEQLKREHKELKVYRALLGIGLLVILALDGWQITRIPLFITAVDNSSELQGYIKTVISSAFLILLVTPFLDFLKTNQQENENHMEHKSLNEFLKSALTNREMCIRIQMLLLVFPLLIPMVTVTILKDNQMGLFKILLSFAGCIAVLIIDAIQLTYFRSVEKVNKVAISNETNPLTKSSGVNTNQDEE